MNPVFFRMLFYVAAPLVATLPGVTFNADAGTVLIDIETAAAGLAIALTGVVAVFKKWGKS